jgi:hypothetical protein
MVHFFPSFGIRYQEKSGNPDVVAEVWATTTKTWLQGCSPSVRHPWL